METTNGTCSYTYSAKQQDEVKKIYERYAAKGKDENKMDKLIRLDKKANMWGNIASIVLGTLGALTFGIGMCFGLVWNGSIMGIIFGIVGTVIAGGAFFIGKLINTHIKKKVTPEILALCKELMN